MVSKATILLFITQLTILIYISMTYDNIRKGKLNTTDNNAKKIKTNLILNAMILAFSLAQLPTLFILSNAFRIRFKSGSEECFKALTERGNPLLIGFNGSLAFISLVISSINFGLLNQEKIKEDGNSYKPPCNNTIVLIIMGVMLFCSFGALGYQNMSKISKATKALALAKVKEKPNNV